MHIYKKFFLRPISLKDFSNIYTTINREKSYLRKWLPFADAI